MILYHRTTDAAAAAILRNGFRDGTGSYMTCESHTGVWLSDVPLDCNEGAHGDALLRVQLALDHGAIADFEWIEECKGYREWLIPAELINKHATVRVIDEYEDEEVAEIRRPKIEAMRALIERMERGLAAPAPRKAKAGK